MSIMELVDEDTRKVSKDFIEKLKRGEIPRLKHPDEMRVKEDSQDSQNYPLDKALRSFESLSKSKELDYFS